MRACPPGAFPQRPLPPIQPAHDVTKTFAKFCTASTAPCHRPNSCASTPPRHFNCECCGPLLSEQHGLSETAAVCEAHLLAPHMYLLGASVAGTWHRPPTRRFRPSCFCARAVGVREQQRPVPVFLCPKTRARPWNSPPRLFRRASSFLLYAGHTGTPLCRPTRPSKTSLAGATLLRRCRLRQRSHAPSLLTSSLCECCVAQRPCPLL